MTHPPHDSDGHRVADIVEGIYDAILEPSRWRDVLRDLASGIGGERPVLFGHDLERRAGGLSLALGIDERMARDYDDYYHARNVWLKAGRNLLKSGTVRTSDMMCSRADLERSEFFNDYLRPLGSTHGLGATIWHEGTHTYNITVMRPASAPAFGSEEIQFVQSLMPHLRRSIQIHRHLAHITAQERAQAEALDRIPAGLLLVDGRHRVVFSNRAARSIADAADGLRVFDGRLTTDRPAETKTLHELVVDAAAKRAVGSPAGGGVMTVTRRSFAAPLSVLVTSLAVGRDFMVSDPPVAAVFVFDHDAPAEPPESVLVRLHGLSRAEARVVGRLLTGDTVDRAADALAISVHTARTHLKRALAKTGTNRQTDLLRRVLTGPAGYRGVKDVVR